MHFFMSHTLFQKYSEIFACNEIYEINSEKLFKSLNAREKISKKIYVFYIFGFSMIYIIEGGGGV